MNKTFAKLSGIGLACIALVAMVGCDDGKMATESVVGKVTLDGEPVAEATVNFSPAVEGKGTPSYGRTDANGEYKLQTLLGRADAGTTPGEYVVTVSKTISVETGKTTVSSDGTKIAETKPKETLPAKYVDAKTTPLKATVKQGANNIPLELSSN